MHTKYYIKQWHRYKKIIFEWFYNKLNPQFLNVPFLLEKSFSGKNTES